MSSVGDSEAEEITRTTFYPSRKTKLIKPTKFT